MTPGATMKPATGTTDAPTPPPPMPDLPEPSTSAPAGGSSLWLALSARAVDRLKYELRRSIPVLLLWGGAASLVLGAQGLGYLAYFQDLLWDRYGAAQELSGGALRGEAEPVLPALLVEINAEDLKRWGPLPWSWERYEALLTALEPADIRALAVAVPASRILATPRNILEIPPDSRVRQWLDKGTLLLPSGLLPLQEDLAQPLSVVEPGSQVLEPEQGSPGAANGAGLVVRVEVDGDGRVRRIPLTALTPSGPVPTVMGVLMERLGARQATVDGENSTPSSLRIFVPGRAQAVPRVSFQQLLEGRVGSAQLKGAVLVLGPARAVDNGYGVPDVFESRRMSEAELLTLGAWQLKKGPWQIPIPYSMPVLMGITLLMSGWMLRQYMSRLLVGVAVIAMAFILFDFFCFTNGWTMPSAAALAVIFSMTGILGTSWIFRIRRLLRGFETRLWQVGALRGQERDAQTALLERVYRLVNPVRPMHSVMLAVPEKEMRWLRIVGGMGAQEADILERRRDFGRDPYLTALQVVESPAVRGYMRDASLSTYMVPLRYLEELQGFLVVNLAPGHSTEVVRWMRALAPEVASRLHVLQLERRKQRGFEQGEYEEAMDQLESSTRALFEERERLETVIENMGPGLLQADRLGQIRLVNRTLQNLLRTLGLTDPDISLATLVAGLSGVTEAEVGRKLESVMFHGEPYGFLVTMKEKGQRLYRAELSGLWLRNARESGLLRLPDGWMLTVMDVTEVHSQDRLELMHAQLQNHLTVLQGYAGLLELTSDPSQWDRAWIDALTDRARDLVHFVGQWSQQDHAHSLKAVAGGKAAEPTDLISLLEEVTAELNRLHPGGVTLKAPAAGAAPVFIDRERGRRGLMALLDDLLDSDAPSLPLNIRIEEGELAHQRLFIDNALLRLPPMAIRRLFAPMRPEELEHLSEPTGLLVARKLIAESGGALREDPTVLAQGIVAIEFPKA